MVALELDTLLPCPPERVRALLVDSAFLEAFVHEQHPTEHRIDVDSAGRTGTAAWTVSLPADVPGIVKQIVGSRLSLTLTVDVSAEGHLHLDAVGKKSGQVRTALTLEPAAGGTRLLIKGVVDVSAGLLSGQAAKLARDQVVKPVLHEDLFRLLRDWCSCSSEVVPPR